MKTLKKTSTDIRWKAFITSVGKYQKVIAIYFSKQVQDYIDYIENNPQMFSWIKEVTLEKFKKISDEDMDGMIDDIIEFTMEAFIQWQNFTEKDIQKDITTWVSFDIDNTDAKDWAKVNAGLLIRWINETTQEEIANLIEKAIEEGLSMFEVSQRIKDKFQQYTEYRASLIANMEISTAFAEGKKIQLEKYQNYFNTTWYKRNQDQWDSAVRSDHADNTEEWWIPADQLFKATQTLHEPHSFNCRCVVSYRLTKPE